jgi:hypothetical protein
VGLRDAEATAGDPGVVDVDALPTIGLLNLKVLAARWRLGEHNWTFPIRLQAALDALHARGLLWRERAWTSIGRLVLAGGSVVCTSFKPSQPDGAGHG